MNNTSYTALYFLIISQGEQVVAGLKNSQA